MCRQGAGIATKPCSDATMKSAQTCGQQKKSLWMVMLIHQRRDAEKEEDHGEQHCSSSSRAQQQSPLCYPYGILSVKPWELSS